MDISKTRDEVHLQNGCNLHWQHTVHFHECNLGQEQQEQYWWLLQMSLLLCCSFWSSSFSFLIIKYRFSSFMASLIPTSQSTLTSRQTRLSGHCDHHAWNSWHRNSSSPCTQLCRSVSATTGCTSSILAENKRGKIFECTQFFVGYLSYYLSPFIFSFTTHNNYHYHI